LAGLEQMLGGFGGHDLIVRFSGGIDCKSGKEILEGWK